MRILFLLSIFYSTFFAATVINQNIYEKENSVDIMLSFDSPYEGKIIQKQDKENKIFILEDTTIEKKRSEPINSDILQQLQLIPYHNQLFIELSGDTPFNVDASKTVDNYGLRLRITPQKDQEQLSDFVIASEQKKIETKKEDGIGLAYLKVMLILFALIAFLYLLKNWLEKRGSSLQGGWLFDKVQEKKQESIKVVHQRALDVKNRVALISYGEKEYLVLLGSNNLLLDSFQKSDTTQKSEFDEVLSQNQEELNDFIKLKNSKFQSYKQKISEEI